MFIEKDKAIWILGSGKSALGSLRKLHEMKQRVFLSDVKNLDESMKKELHEKGIAYEEAGHTLSLLEKEAQLVILSPGILKNNPAVLKALECGIPVWSEIELALRLINPSSKVIGITGTNGKSTTTAYLAQLLEKEGTSLPCGNFGLPFIDVISQNLAFYTVELSSYQLESIETQRFDVGIFLNLQEDHLARYGNLEEYFKAKWRLAHLVKKEGLFIISEDILQKAITMGLSLPLCQLQVISSSKDFHTENNDIKYSPFPWSRLLPLSTYQNLKKIDIKTLAKHFHFNLVYSHPEHQKFEILGKEKCHIQESILLGKHNFENILYASLASLFLKIPLEKVKGQWEKKSSTYTHIPHRLELVADGLCQYQEEMRNLRIYNDSKATNVESTKVALESFPQKVRLLLGGDPKGESFKPLEKYLGKQVVKVYPFGKAALQIGEDLQESKTFLSPPQKSMKDAFLLALHESENDDCILLSPACASFDEFKNFEHRGDMFRNLAQSVLKGN